MTLTSAWWSGVTGLLVDSALRATVLAAAAGIGLAAFRVKATSLRLWTWNVVLGTALAMPLLAGLLPVISVPLPSSLQQRSAASSVDTVFFSSGTSAATHPAPGYVRVENIDHVRRFSAAAASSETSSDPSSALRWTSMNWLAIANGIYFLIAAILIARLAAGIVLSRRLIRRSRPVLESRITERLLPSAGGLEARVRVFESQVVSVPVTMGAIRPVILLPLDWREWNEAKIDAVIAHELSHVVRRDALTQLFSRIHCAIFWFSPLAWWLDRQVNILAEQASDEAALSSGADSTEYAKALLGFFESLQAAPGRVWWQGVSMAKAGQAEHRLEKILSWRGVVHMGVKKSVLVAFIALAVPSVYLVAAAHPANYNLIAAQTSDSLPTPAPAVAGTPAPPAVAPVAPAAPGGGVAAAAPRPAAPGSPAITPAPAVAWGAGQSHSYGVGHGYSSSYNYDDQQRFVIVSGNSDTLTMSGDSEDARHVQRLKKQISGDFIWFERDEKSYIIRDKATVDRARSFWAPQEELGKRQEELGKQQEELGRQQEELGSKMEQVKVHVPDMTAQLDALKAKLQKLGSEATMEQVGDLQSEIGELQSRLGEIQGEAGEQQGKFGKLQGELGEKQGKLGAQQGELGQKQAELAEKATKQMKSLLDEAIKNGKAQPEPENGGGASI